MWEPSTSVAASVVCPAPDLEKRSWWHTVQILAPIFGTEFWTVCHTDMVPDFSSTRFWRWSVACSISRQFLVCTWPLWRPVIGRCHCFHFVCIVWWFHCLLSIFCVVQSMLIFGADFFVPDCIWYEKSALTFGADFWSVCHQLKWDRREISSPL